MSDTAVRATDSEVEARREANTAGNDPIVMYQVRRPHVVPGVTCHVIRQSGAATPLPHLAHHSPDGFEIGYSGSGPSDLARSIIGHYLDEPSPDPTIYHAFKFAFLNDASVRDGLDITVAGIAAWFESLRVLKS